MTQVIAAITGAVSELAEHRKVAIDVCIELGVLPLVTGVRGQSKNS
jgi:hypothetical protein